MRRALQFTEQAAFQKAVGLLDLLRSEGPLEYDLVALTNQDGGVVVLPQWSYDRLLPALGKHHVPFAEMETKRMNELAPREQATLRGLKWGPNSSKAPA